MGVSLIGDRDIILDSPFNNVNILARRDAAAIAHAEDMRIDSLRRMPPPHIEDHIGGFAANARQAFQRRAGGRHLPVELIHKALAKADDILRLIAKKSDRLDMRAHLLLAQGQHLFGRIGNGKERLGGAVDPGISGLRRKRNGHDERIGITVVQLALGGRLGGFKPGENLAEGAVIELLGHAPIFPSAAEYARNGSC